MFISYALLRLIKLLVTFSLLLSALANAMLNLITDISWRCMFPLNY
ncbi:hypothetical protein BTN49_1848 [Candidatus Enterovibrio escicola]|uniref:Uncharacterized protein n=1 Tax=Candidatus Enterovibrio escicola TaxID=1927127 RepID=A0A2A5T397_9GAMM|nr:hypothetical protein BTN49_1848 [Candidatus Enterovibrio escacola]